MQVRIPKEYVKALRLYAVEQSTSVPAAVLRLITSTNSIGVIHSAPPGWRLVRAGEKLKAGDLVAWGSLKGAIPAPAGCVVQDKEPMGAHPFGFYIRKLRGKRKAK